MKYLQRLDENFKSTSPKNLKKTNKVDREEILAQIDAAESADDWQTVKELTDFLKGIPESFLIGINDFVLLNETVQEGKAIVQSVMDSEIAELEKEAESKNIDQTGDNAEIQNKIKADIREKMNSKYFGQNSDFEFIKRLLHKTPAYVGAFMRFKYLQNATRQDLESLYSIMMDLRNQLTELPMSIDAYSKVEDQHLPGWESLGDDLNKLLELRKGSWIVKALPKIAMSRAGESPVNLKEQYLKSSHETQLELQRVAAQLTNLNKPALIRLVTGQLSGKPSIAVIINLIKNTIKNADTDKGKLLELAIAAYPSVAIFYSDDNYYVFSFRNDTYLPKLAGKASGWCIQPKWYNQGTGDQFWSYATGTLQLVILDFTVDQTDVYHTVGVTIQPDRSIRPGGMCNQPNECTSGTDYRTVLQKFACGGRRYHSYPNELIDAIEKNFDSEVNFKKSTDETYKLIKQYSTSEKEYAKVIIKTLKGLMNDFGHLVTSGVTKDIASVNSDKNIKNQIIAAEINNIKQSDDVKKLQKEYIEKFSTNKVPDILGTPADVKLFEIVFEDSPMLTDGLLTAMIEKATRLLGLFDKKIKASLAEKAKNPASKTSKPSDGRISVDLEMVQSMYASANDAVIALEALREKIKK